MAIAFVIFMTSVYALVKCFHEFHSEHPLIIALRFFIKSCNLLQSNNKIAKSSKTAKLFKIRATLQKEIRRAHTSVTYITSARRSRVTEHSERTGEEAKKNCSVR
ncbi:hypothetical protein EWT56_25905 [Escherichia coli O25b:H4]|nr:hypothetical protein EWT56_25905 [Escherichia coli O25b:H4]